MPKIYMSLAEKRQAAIEREFRNQERTLRAVIQEKWAENHFKDIEFKDKAKVGINTVTAFKKRPFSLKCENLIKCCAAAGIVIGVVETDKFKI